MSSILIMEKQQSADHRPLTTASITTGDADPKVSVTPCKTLVWIPRREAGRWLVLLRSRRSRLGRLLFLAPFLGKGRGALLGHFSLLLELGCLIFLAVHLGELSGFKQQ